MAQKQKKIPEVNHPVSTRPPIVVVLGHVDHGKTTLLDAIRSTEVASREHGGITQSIGAYQVHVDAGTAGKAGSKQILTFIDTPGHQAFTKMRSHGANVADIAILVVAANDSVMPQTVESIKIIKEAKIPYIVAINKVDLPEANVDKVIQDLLRHDVPLENYGGQVPWVKVSATKKQGLKELIELIELISELEGIKGDPSAPLEAVVIESRLDKNRGPVASAIIRKGKLGVGEKIYIDGIESKVRGLFDYLQKPLTEALPGTPVEIIGLTKVPTTGSQISSSQQSLQEVVSYRPSGIAETNKMLPSDAARLNIILKADTLGSLEAILASLPANVNLLDSGVGEITANDVLLAKDTISIVVGLNTPIEVSGRKIQEAEKVIVRTYKIIYELLEELNDAAAGLIELTQEELLGTGQIIAQFPYEKLKIAGTRVTEGRLARGDTVKILRADQVLGESKIKSLRIGKEESNKVEAGKECGVLLDPQIDFINGDNIQAYKKY